MIFSGLCLSKACCREFFEYRIMRTLSFDNSIMAFAICHGSLAGSKSPSSPLRTNVDIPPTIVETIGMPTNWASQIEFVLPFQFKISLPLSP